MQTITFTAPSGGELRQQLLDFLGMSPTLVEHDSVLDRIVADAVNEVKPPEPVTEIKSRGKKGTKLTGVLSPGVTEQAEQAAEPQGSRAPDVTQVTPGGTGTSPLPEPDKQTVVTPPKEALELKEKVIDALQAAFRAGKVQKVRSVLTQYGNGAKSFREIDIAQFPEIDEALQHGALN